MLNPHCLLCLVLSYVLKTNCSKMTLQLRIWQWNALTLPNCSTFKGINGLPAIWIMNLALDCVTFKIIPYSIILEFRICNSFFSCKHLRCSFTLNKRFGFLSLKKSEIAIHFILLLDNSPRQGGIKCANRRTGFIDSGESHRQRRPQTCAVL